MVKLRMLFVYSSPTKAIFYTLSRDLVSVGQNNQLDISHTYFARWTGKLTVALTTSTKTLMNNDEVVSVSSHYYRNANANPNYQGI